MTFFVTFIIFDGFYISKYEKIWEGGLYAMTVLQ